MSLSVVNLEKKSEEDAIQKSVYSSIDNNKSFIFNSGAGSGKTYALIETLKYIVNTRGEKLKYHNQKVVCITYTNVAVDEIKDRLGQSSTTLVSTIHEMLWSLIKKHQRSLVQIHISKINRELESLSSYLNGSSNDEASKKFTSFIKLEDVDKKKFIKIALAHKDEFYKNYDSKAAGFRQALGTYFSEFSDVLKSVVNFKKIVSTIYKIENYRRCLEGIAEKHQNYQAVRYDSKYNNDVLHRMIISHDTLLDYSLELYLKYDVLKKMTIDTFPIFLVDECQDTSPKVVKIINYLSEYANKKELRFIVGFFGDSVQNIYDDGVGREITQLHGNLENVTKVFNRRSFYEVIEVINKIRGDEIEQRSIYEDCEGGEVKAYYSNLTEKIPLINGFISKCRNDWGISEEEKIHCLVLTNKLVASLSGFESLYNSISTTKYYKKNYDTVNTEFLSQDLTKLGRVPLILFNIVRLKLLLELPKIPVSLIISEEIGSELNLQDLKGLVSKLKSLSGNNLLEFCNSLFTACGTSPLLKSLVRTFIELETYSFTEFNDLLKDNLFPNITDVDIEEVDLLLSGLLSVDFENYLNWYKFISNTNDSNVVYHTYHSTKGLEFDNVVIVLENSFGRSKNMFSNFFKQVTDQGNITSDQKVNFEKTKNLLYVSCSRAIKNLRIIYVDDINEFRENLQYVFGSIEEYT